MILWYDYYVVLNFADLISKSFDFLELLKLLGEARIWNVSLSTSSGAWVDIGFELCRRHEVYILGEKWEWWEFRGISSHVFKLERSSCVKHEVSRVWQQCSIFWFSYESILNTHLMKERVGYPPDIVPTTSKNALFCTNWFLVAVWTSFALAVYIPIFLG